MKRLSLVLVSVIAAGATVATVAHDLTDLAIADALAIARSPTEAPRRAFHAGYYMSVNQAPVTSISIVTEFRRVVIAAEERLRFGDRLWGLREAREVLRSFTNKLDIVAELVFHPQNAYATLPEFGMALVPKEGPEIRPVQLSRTAKYTPLPMTPAEAMYYPYPPPTLPVAPGGQTILGAWVVATFDATAIDPNAYLVVAVREGVTDLTRAAVDFSRLR
jgi:hypothetical protein